MPKYTVKIQPTGLLNGQYWPEAGETVDLPSEVGDAMVKVGNLERRQAAEKTAEKRPASKAGVETRKDS